MTRKSPDWIAAGAILTLLATTVTAVSLVYRYRTEADGLRSPPQWQCPQYPQPVVLPRPLKKIT